MEHEILKNPIPAEYSTPHKLAPKLCLYSLHQPWFLEGVSYFYECYKQSSANGRFICWVSHFGGIELLIHINPHPSSHSFQLYPVNCGCVYVYI